MATTQPGVVEVSIPLPRALDTRIFIRLTTQAKSIMLSLATGSLDDAVKPMGSFVYALPNRLDPQHPLATTLFSSESSLEFTTRLAKLIAHRTGLPVYVTNSISLENAGMGGTVEEEMEAFKNVVDVVLARLKSADIVSAVANVSLT